MKPFIGSSEEEPQAPNPKRRVMVGAIGKCVHNLGVENFADWMEDQGLGYITVKLGPAVPIREVINKIREARPEVVGVSMRLGDLHVDALITEFVEAATEYGLGPRESGIRYSFGGLRPACNLVRAMTGMPLEEDRFIRDAERHYDLEAVAKEYKKRPEFQSFFALIADDFVTMEELESFALKLPSEREQSKLEWSDSLVERIRQVRERENRPIIRAHIGIAAATIEPTIKAIEKLADAGAFEIVSLAPDQTSQELLAKFIRGEEDPSKYLAGQGGAPIRTVDDLKRLKAATQRGNFPMTRIYTGTDELVALARLWEEHLNICFPAVPIFFYNELDGRGPISIRDAFDEHFRTIQYWAQVGKPLEINDPHQWGLRYTSDDLQVTDHVLCAIIALKKGVKHYVMQMMFELPPEISAMDDLAKMKAAYDLAEPLTRHFDFNIIKETRSGLPSFPPNLNQAKGHLAFGIYTQLYMEPDILHVVTHSEAHHEASADDIIESCEITKQVCWDFIKGHVPQVWSDPLMRSRIQELKQGAMYNVLHAALLGGYVGPVNPENFWDWAKDPSEDPDQNYETLLLSIIDESNYATGICGVIGGDTLDLGLQIGLFQGPHVTVVDRRYEMAGACRTKVVNGMCRTDEWNGIKVNSEFERVDLVRKRYPWYFDKVISSADDATFIGQDAEVEAMDEAAVARYRNRIGITRPVDGKVLVVDFGSTFSKIGIFDAEDETFSLKYVPTTVDDLRIGLANGLGVLAACEQRGDWKPLGDKMSEFAIRLPCSSAKGGLKVATVSLVREESSFAADLAALTAGAKLVGSYAGKLTTEQARAIYENDQPEIILLAGGTNQGGDTETQLHNAHMLAEAARFATYTQYGVPVVYAGNQDIRGQIETIFRHHHIDVRMTENVMPEINEFHIEVVNEAIRELFQTVIIRGKGFDVVEEYMDAPFVPTPRAAFHGINLLAHGYGNEPGIGNILALDIGGATTDFYSNVLDNPLYQFPGDDGQRRVKRTILKTPNVPLVYRRVEGKYGLAYNAENLKELKRFKDGSMTADMARYLADRLPDDFRPGDGQFSQFLSRRHGSTVIDLDSYLSWISRNPHLTPENELENGANSFLAKEIMAIATGNNVGFVRETETYFLQHGVNFFNQKVTVLLIGGTIYHACLDEKPGYQQDLALIASGALYNPAEEFLLRPGGPVLLDASYLVSALGGLYGRVHPEQALRVMKRELISLNIVENSRVPIASSPYVYSRSGSEAFENRR
ncbi:MAG TPA: glutamate mutase L [Anaerolineales bacterium]|nr:glutamate mutase L [Anaerolineales bacterium]